MTTADRLLIEAQQEIRQLTEALDACARRRAVEFQAATKEMEKFSYSVAHDLRAPLGAIAGYCQVLEEKESAQLSPRGRHYLERIRAAAHQMDAMTEGMLSLARLSHAPLRRDVIDLAAIAAQVLGSLKTREPLREVQVDMLPEIWAEGDPTLLHHVVSNLLSNAWKFTRNEPLARIEMGMKMGAGDEPVYFVKDNGAGFDMTHASRIFDVFHRLHGVAEFEGTGIGLATVHKIIDRHGGRIWAEAAVGAGATFYFTLSAPAGKENTRVSETSSSPSATTAACF